MRDSLDLYEFYVLLANSLRAEEREQYNLAKNVYTGVNNPKGLKNWKWYYDDVSTGTRIKGDTPQDSLIAFATSKIGHMEAHGNGLEFAKATGRPYGFLDSEGHLMNDFGQPIENIPGMVIIKLSPRPN